MKPEFIFLEAEASKHLATKRNGISKFKNKKAKVLSKYDEQNREKT